MFAYCNNNPVMGYDPTGEYCVANKDGTDTNYLDDWLIEGAGAGGYGGTGNYFGYGTSYYSYSIRNYSSATNNPRYYNVVGAVSVNDGMAVGGGKITSNITNDVIDLPRTGSALKTDLYHQFPNIVDNYAGDASKFNIDNGVLYQIEGSFGGKNGRFEWIVENGYVTHRFFVKGGSINGIPSRK